ncbi:acetyl-CoA synthase corrinoid activation protein [Dehalogenimonas sp. WBC-2]|nr:acetyl-CoA synthase corrinoid activation protein [Dehalogenimonas sp. WBC-2]
MDQQPPVKFKVFFQPDNVAVEAGRGDNLLETARRAGVGILASCGGDGVCGTCRVIIKQGEVESPCSLHLSPGEFDAGVRLACQCKVMSHLTVEVPPESCAPASEGHLRSLITNEEAMTACDWRFAPPVFKLFLKLAPPTLEDNSSDLTRLERELEHQGIKNTRFNIGLLKKITAAVRDGAWNVTLTVLKESDGLRLTSIQPGDTRSRFFGVAFDIGTTGVRGELLDLNEGSVLAQGVEYNSQRNYGDDVISRISYAGKSGGLEKLQLAIVTNLNQLIIEMTQKAGVQTTDIDQICVAANTTMVQLLLGLDPKPLRLAPYVPTATILPTFPAGDFKLSVNHDVPLIVMPSVASYIGGDIISGLMGTGIFQRQETVLYIDIGTNGEIVVGNAEWMISASCSAGPAFEGGGIRHGMIATSGAIEGYNIDKPSQKITISTVGGGKPRGICGAGLISMVAALFAAGIIDQKGKFQDGKSERVRSGTDGFEYLLVEALDSETGKDIVLTEIDVDNLLRAKGAMYAGYQTLLSSVDMAFDQLDKVVIAGTFGSCLNIEDAVTIGLLPDIDRNKFRFVGNGSLLGARLCSFSRELVEASKGVARLVTNVELSENNAFMDNYIASMFLPHTNFDLFPEVKRRLSTLAEETSS